MNQKREAGKSKADGKPSDKFQRPSYVPSVEEQFKTLQPSRELLDFYRNKLAFYEKEFTRMTEKVTVCKRALGGDGAMKKDLKRCNDEIFTLQKALSDIQVYLHQERNQVLLLHSENDRLKIQLAKDRKTINFLLPLCGTTEDQVCYLINQGNTESLNLAQANQTEGKFKPFKTEKSDTETRNDPEIMTLKVNALEAQLKEITKASRDEIHSLHQDRELLQMEKEKEYLKLQNQISVLTDRLSTANINICELTSEIITLKNNFIKKEEELILIKEKRQNKHLYGCHDETSEPCENKPKTQKHTALKVLKDHLQHKEKLIKLYKEQCVSLENELRELTISKEKSNEMLQVQMEKMNKQLSDIKDKYQQLYQKRSLEAEGFKSDVKILKGRFHSLERKLKTYFYSVNAPQRKELLDTARETMTTAKCLEKELGQIKNKLIRLDLVE